MLAVVLAIGLEKDMCLQHRDGDAKIFVIQPNFAKGIHIVILFIALTAVNYMMIVMTQIMKPRVANIMNHSRKS